MSNTDHTARPESWDEQKSWAVDDSDSDCILELRARVERLEQAQQQPAPRYNLRFRDVDLVPPIDCPDPMLWIAERVYEMAQQQPAPSTPAGQGELFDSVAAVMSESPTDVILAVADWLADKGAIIGPDLLRREVER